MPSRQDPVGGDRLANHFPSGKETKSVKTVGHRGHRTSKVDDDEGFPAVQGQEIGEVTRLTK